MANSTVYFKGIDALERGLKERATLSDVKKTVALNGSEMTEQAKRNAPVKTGDLRGSIKQSISDGGLTAKAAPSVDYAAYQELGTRFFYGQYYMKRAHNTQEGKFIGDIKRLMK